MFLHCQNFLPKLKSHLLPRILATLPKSDGTDNNSQLEASPNSVLFKHDRLYRHNIMRVNFTSYDVRRSQDVVHASTAHHNVMVLADQEAEEDSHLFKYAQVLGIYHVNAVYTGPGMINYEPIRMEFLWVRWYRHIKTMKCGWDSMALDRVDFPPIAEDNSFGFLDPSHVLRCTHIIPQFAKDKRHSDGIGLSNCAQDRSDWTAYYINR